jgi:hypothetical protein
MPNFEDVPTIATPVTPNFQLTPPEVITPVPAEATPRSMTRSRASSMH